VLVDLDCLDSGRVAAKAAQSLLSAFRPKTQQVAAATTIQRLTAKRERHEKPTHSTAELLGLELTQGSVAMRVTADSRER